MRATRRASPISLTVARYRTRQGSAGVVACRVIAECLDSYRGTLKDFRLNKGKPENDTVTPPLDPTRRPQAKTSCRHMPLPLALTPVNVSFPDDD